CCALCRRGRAQSFCRACGGASAARRHRQDPGCGYSCPPSTFETAPIIAACLAPPLKLRDRAIELNAVTARINVKWGGLRPTHEPTPRRPGATRPAFICGAAAATNLGARRRR